MGFRLQIMLILVSLSIICTGLMSFIGYTVTNKLNKELVLNSLQVKVDDTYNLIDSAVNTSIKNYLGTIAEIDAEIVESYYARFKSGELTEDAAKKEIEKILLAQKVGQTGYVYVVDSQGLLQVHPYLKNTDLSNFDFIKTQIVQKQGYLEYSWKNPADRIEKKKAMSMTYFKPWDYIISVSSYKTEFVNLVNTQDFKANILSTVVGATGYMFIMDSKGQLIIHPKQEGASIYDSVDSQGKKFIQEIIKNKNGTVVYPWKNPGEESARDKIVVYKYYQPMDWYICSGVYVNELIKPVQLLKKKFRIISLSILLLSILISHIYSKAILRPVKMLITAAERVINGNFDINIKNVRNDEIGHLTNIFNQMILKVKIYMESIRMANQKLEEANVGLEQKVKERTEQLELLSNLDGMTGIANRRKMDEYLNHAWELTLRNKHPLSLIILDIDFYKNYNDTYGHPAGDECLKKIARAISVSLKRSTDFAARYGGEEFVVILSNTDQAGAAEVAENIRKKIEGLEIPHVSSLVSSYVTVSLGVSTLLDFQNQSLPAFIRSADEALYAAKESGRNRSIAVVCPARHEGNDHGSDNC
ncbi:diguanylate cyclase [Desulfopila sp. IMCC35006]|uniref:diguanylate cyclase n=1 Tax=Desulfopila sp. IMCC35006 TaxID=2569542 RepID=UPI00142EC604|nr:diguanylate cyclase [Desulfopila sp. IMCC35006]